MASSSSPRAPDPLQMDTFRSSSSPSTASPPIAMEDDSSCLTCCLCGKKISWHQAIPTCGEATSIAAVVLAIISAYCFPAVAAPLALGAAGCACGSCIAHGGSSVAICCVKGYGDVERTVIRGHEAADEVRSTAQQIVAATAAQGKLLEDEARILQEELEEKAKLEQGLREKTKEFEQLTQRLREAESGIKKSQPAIEAFSSTLGKVKDLFSRLPAQVGEIPKNIGKLTEAIGELKLIGTRAEDMATTTAELGTAYVNAEVLFNQTMNTISEKLTALAEDNESLRTQNIHLETQIKGLTNELEKSQPLFDRVEDLNQQLSRVNALAKEQKATIDTNDATIENLRATNSHYETLFKRPDIQALINQ